MKFSTTIRIFLVCAMLASAGTIPLLAQSPGDRDKPKLIEFDPPGAATENSVFCVPLCGTLAYANNSLGEVTGFFTDANVVPHGFLRSPEGKFTVFDAPGSGQGYFLDQGTVPYSINDAGVITGQFEDSSQSFHGFIRYRDGSFITFDVPNAVGTVPWDINLEGTTAGIYFDANGFHGFVRSPSGKTTEFDPTGSVYTYVCEETCLNEGGSIAGFYSDANGLTHGFLRHPDGKITVIDVTGAANGTYPASINNEGTIGGYYVDSTATCYGFIRKADGKISTFSLSGAGTGNFDGTVPYSINDGDTVTGVIYDSIGSMHAFSRSLWGKVARFKAPDGGTGSNQGTRPSTNNREGAVAGWYVDANNLNHGFVWIPGEDCSGDDDE